MVYFVKDEKNVNCAHECFDEMEFDLYNTFAAYIYKKVYGKMDDDEYLIRSTLKKLIGK